MHVEYTAKDGGDLKVAARKALGLTDMLPIPTRKEPPKPIQQAQLFSAKHNFSSDWYRFMHPGDTATSQALSLDLSQARFPFQVQGQPADTLHIQKMRLFLKLKATFTRQEGFTYDDTNALHFALKNEQDPVTNPPTFTPFPDDFLVGTSPITGVPSPITGVPYAEPLPEGQSGHIGQWIIEVQGSDLAKIVPTDPSTPSLQVTVTVNGQDFHHLNPDAIEDIWIVCEYSTK